MNRAVIFMGSARMDRAARTRRNCSTEFDGDHCIEFREPEPVRFGKALTYIKCVQRSNLPTLVALDQPTIVRNADGMRPLDRVVAGLISWTGRGVHTPCPGPLALWRRKPSRCPRERVGVGYYRATVVGGRLHILS